MRRKGLKALRAAFPHTLPVLAGYMFLGIAFGVFMRAEGFPFWMPVLLSAAVYGGSLQFVAVSVLSAPFAPVQTLLLTLMVQARHLFYGVAMLEKYRGMGAKKPYLIFALTDETFSINCAAEPPEDVDRGLFMLFISLLDQLYWIGGTAVGAALGRNLPFNTQGIDFAMTALFVVIFLEHWIKDARHLGALIGLAVSAVCLLLFSAENFLLPAMAGILAMLTVCRKPIERAGEAV